MEIAKVLETTHPGSPTPLVKPNRILNVKLRKNRQHSKGRRGSHEHGTMDFFMVLELPSEDVAIKFALFVGASGVFRGNLTPLITVEQMDSAHAADLPSMRLPGE